MPEDAERWSVWVDKDLATGIRLVAAVRGLSQRGITETALREWLERNPVDAAAIEATIDRARGPQ